MLEYIAANTNVIIPLACMDKIDDAIEIDGLLLARVPFSVELEISRYGPQDPLGMLAFRVACIPDTSDWPICDDCVLAIEKRLQSRFQLASGLSMSWWGFVNYADWDNNTFRDLLMTMLRQLWQGCMEFNVYSFFFNYLERGSI
jgi:hypothetical protein